MIGNVSCSSWCHFRRLSARYAPPVSAPDHIPSPQTLMLTGDSLLNLGNDWVGTIQAGLPGWQVLNCATGGFTIRDLAERAGLLARLRPSAVLWSAGLNDLAQWKEPVALEDYSAGIGEVAAAFASSRRIMLLPPLPVEERQEAKFSRTRADAELYREAARAACTANDVEMIDGELLAADARSRGHESHRDDGVHLEEGTYQALVRELAALLA